MNPLDVLKDIFNHSLETNNVEIAKYIKEKTPDAAVFHSSLKVRLIPQNIYTIKFMLENGYKFDEDDEVYYAVYEYDLELTRLLLKYYPGVREHFLAQYTEHGFMELARIAIESGANISKTIALSRDYGYYNSADYLLSIKPKVKQE